MYQFPSIVSNHVWKFSLLQSQNQSLGEKNGSFLFTVDINNWAITLSAMEQENLTFIS